MIEDELLKWKFKQGSTEALSGIYQKYLDDLLTLAAGLLNDPDEAEIVISLEGTSEDSPPSDPDSDDDAVDDDIEDGAPNNGDGNNDGEPDSLQQHVTSMPVSSGGYVTLEAPVGSRLVDCSILESPSPSDAPAGVYFEGSSSHR